MTTASGRPADALALTSRAVLCKKVRAEISPGSISIIVEHISAFPAETVVIYAAFLGLCIGSFLNAAIYRVPRKISVLSPRRSFCPSCGTQLRATDNIPVLSWMLLRGKCRYCKAPISGRYPFVEILSGIAAVACVVRFDGLNLTSVVIYALVASLIVITFIDLDFKIIPNVISLPGMTLGLLLSIYSQFTHEYPTTPATIWKHGSAAAGALAQLSHETISTASSLSLSANPPLTSGCVDSLLGLVAGGGFFLLIGFFYHAATKTVGLGMGDVKLMGMTGAILGLKSVAPTIFFGSLFGSIIGILLMLLGRGGRKSEIPFGPWLSLGCLIYIFADVPLWRF